jgi:putative transposase
MLFTSKAKAHFKGFLFPADIILSAVYMKCKFTLSYRDIEELCSMRGIEVDHSTIQRWMRRFVPLLDKTFRKKKQLVNDSWRMDETYIKVRSKWVYLYRAVDKYGDTIDFLLRAKRDKVAAKAFFRKAIKHNRQPRIINIDKSGSNTYALEDINKELGGNKEKEIVIRQNKYLNNRIEGDHRFIKKITRPMLGFKSFYSARVTITGIEIAHMIRKKQIENETNLKNYQVFANLINL